MGLIRKLKTLQKLSKILRFIDPKKLVDINDILEKVYPGIQKELEGIVERYDIHAITRAFQYINAHGGTAKIAEYYNAADQQGQVNIRSAFSKAFKPGAPFEDAVMTLDGLAKLKDMGLYTQLFGDIKDSIIMTSVKYHYRTVADWRTFVRRQHEANKDVLLGILDEIQEEEEQQETTKVEELEASPSEEKHEEEKPSEDTDDENHENEDSPANDTIYNFPAGLMTDLYEYNGDIFKPVPDIHEFIGILLRKSHEYKLVEYTGKKVLMYHIIERLSRLLPEDQRRLWKEDIVKECGYDIVTVSKKFNDTTNMKAENLDLFKKLNRMFDVYDVHK